jgi:uncharacterized protein with HEPN domain
LIRDEVYLRHILDAIEVLRGYAVVGESAFMRDGMRQDAVVRQLAVIGEAAKLLSADSRDSEPDIPWREIAGMRDRLIHGYASVDLNTVWRTVERDIPPLREAVRRLLGIA